MHSYEWSFYYIVISDLSPYSRSKYTRDAIPGLLGRQPPLPSYLLLYAVATLRFLRGWRGWSRAPKRGRWRLGESSVAVAYDGSDTEQFSLPRLLEDDIWERASWNRQGARSWNCISRQAVHATDATLGRVRCSADAALVPWVPPGPQTSGRLREFDLGRVAPGCE